MEIRDLTAAHASKLERFQIGGRPRERYLLEIRELVRDVLPDALRTGRCSAVGGFDRGELIAVAAWASQPGPRPSWRVIAIAVGEGHVRRGHGKAMKQAMVERARDRGIETIVSFVHVDNLAAQAMNASLGAAGVLDPGDPTRNWMLYVLEV